MPDFFSLEFSSELPRKRASGHDTYHSAKKKFELHQELNDEGLKV
jgi:hypothetical protein